MSCLKAGCSVYGSNDSSFKKRAIKVCSSIGTLQPRTLDVSDLRNLKLDFVTAHPTISLSKGQRGWNAKSHVANMMEIQSAQQLVDILLSAENHLVVMDFYSTACGACNTLHPKICQISEMNQNAIFLRINYEVHKTMCCALHVHVLPFFTFYRGAEGRLSSFSCTNATIKKFKDALSKHGTDRCSLGPAKGLDEEDMDALASLGMISRDLLPNESIGQRC